MKKIAILCVDDETIILESLREQLHNQFGADCLIETAVNGNEALEVFEDLLNDNIDVPVVIADYIMPEMTGDKLLEKVHRLNYKTRTILLTGQASIGGVEYAVNNARLYRFISKPWDRNDLILTVREAIHSYEQDGRIELQNAELRELNASLELKVELRTRELRELNAMKDKFFSIIAHDLKNPFNTLLGFSELLTNNFDDYGVEKAKEFIRLIFETSKNGYALLENLLEWSRSQTGRIVYQPDMINLLLVCEEIKSMNQARAKEKGIALWTAISDQTVVWADPNMLRTTLRNLVSNAIKFTDTNGKVIITATSKTDLVEISVSDTGVGMTQEDMSKLFRIDISHSTPGTKEETGTGIGLVLCKEFVNRHGSDITVESEPGKGSIFRFYLPKTQPAE